MILQNRVISPTRCIKFVISIATSKFDRQGTIKNAPAVTSTESTDSAICRISIWIQSYSEKRVSIENANVSFQYLT